MISTAYHIWLCFVKGLSFLQLEWQLSYKTAVGPLFAVVVMLVWCIAYLDDW